MLLASAVKHGAPVAPVGNDGAPVVALDLGPWGNFVFAFNINADGNCWFRLVNQWITDALRNVKYRQHNGLPFRKNLRESEFQEAKLLRERVCDWMAANPEQMGIFAEADGEDLGAYILRMRDAGEWKGLKMIRSGAWSGHRQVFATAQVLKHPIFVLVVNHNQKKRK